MRAIVRPVDDVLVGPLEIERVDQRLAHAPVFKFLAPRIDKPSLGTRRRIVGQHVALDASVLEGRKVIARRPETRREFLAEEIIPACKALEPDFPVTVILEPQHIEIILPARNRKFRAPPILHPLKLDEMTDLELSDLVRS